MFVNDMYRVASCCPTVSVSNPDYNSDVIIKMIEKENKCDVMLFPELSTTAYTCGDLFSFSTLLNNSNKAIAKIANVVKDKLVVIGAPIEHNGALFNCAIVISNHNVIGIVPKTFLPNYREFYEKRWFASGSTVKDDFVELNGAIIPFGTDLLFKHKSLVVGIEVCEDVWSVIPPSSFQALAGANLILNLSASNELVGKAEYRTNLVKHQSEKLICAYAYSSSGTGESTTDLVFGGHCMIYENGNKLVETDRFAINENSICCSDIDVEKLSNERKKNPTFNDSKMFLNKKFRTIDFKLFIKAFSDLSSFNLLRPKNPYPFLPSNPLEKNKNFNEIVNIQICGIIKRINQLKNKNVYIGISGGSDSTEALLALVAAYDRMGLDRKLITGITMPGFGTSEKTKNNSYALMDILGISQKTINISDLASQTFNDISHAPFDMQYSQFLTKDKINEFLLTVKEDAKDLTFENVQARLRTFILMSHGFVIGTGDMSELALGWCTYNGDHMSMYNPNCSIPKTLVKELIMYFADNSFAIFKEVNSDDLKNVLNSIYKTVISPELLPLKDGEIAQSSENEVGPYELVDYFLYNFIRNGFSFAKISVLAFNDFDGKYSIDEIKKWLKLFITRFFIAQFKRSCVPDGPKVGSVSLSPRGDWRMPSDADVKGWINGL